MRTNHDGERQTPTERELFLGPSGRHAALSATRCHYPLLALAGLALSAAGTAASMQGQAKARSAVSKAQAAEAQRQADYQKRANTVFQDSLKTSGRDTAEQEIEQGAQKRLAGYSAINAAAAPTATATPAETMNRIVAPFAPRLTATANQDSVTAAWNNIIGKAQSRSGGYADWGLNEAVRNRRAAEALGFINKDAKISAKISKLEAEDAAHAGDSLAFIGKGLSDLGGTVGYWGATRPSSTPNGAPITPMAPMDIEPIPVGGMSERDWALYRAYGS